MVHKGHLSAATASPKTARFAEEENLLTVRIFETVDDSNPSELWYSQEESVALHEENRRVAHQWRKEGLSECLNDTFGHSHDHEVQSQLNLYVELCGNYSVRGLEKLVCQSHVENRKCNKEIFFEIFLANQRELEKLVGISTEEKWSILSSLSSDLSDEATVFARRIGIADELTMRLSTAGDINQMKNNNKSETKSNPSIDGATPTYSRSHMSSFVAKQHSSPMHSSIAKIRKL